MAAAIAAARQSEWVSAVNFNDLRLDVVVLNDQV